MDKSIQYYESKEPGLREFLNSECKFEEQAIVLNKGKQYASTK